MSSGQGELLHSELSTGQAAAPSCPGISHSTVVQDNDNDTELAFHIVMWENLHQISCWPTQSELQGASQVTVVPLLTATPMDWQKSI